MNNIENLICQLTVGDPGKIAEAANAAASCPSDREQEKRFTRMIDAYLPAKEIIAETGTLLLKELSTQDPAAGAALKALEESGNALIKGNRKAYDILTKLTTPVKKRISGFFYRVLMYA